MQKYMGVIEVSYNYRDIRIPYTMDNLGGSVHIYYQDKYGHHHGFFYRDSEDIWLATVNKSPVWPTEFSQRFFRECKKEAKKHGLIKE